MACVNHKSLRQLNNRLVLAWTLISTLVQRADVTFFAAPSCYVIFQWILTQHLQEKGQGKRERETTSHHHLLRVPFVFQESLASSSRDLSFVRPRALRLRIEVENPPLSNLRGTRTPKSIVLRISKLFLCIAIGFPWWFLGDFPKSKCCLFCWPLCDKPPQWGFGVGHFFF